MAQPHIYPSSDASGDVDALALNHSAQHVRLLHPATRERSTVTGRMRGAVRGRLCNCGWDGEHRHHVRAGPVQSRFRRRQLATTSPSAARRRAVARGNREGGRPFNALFTAYANTDQFRPQVCQCGHPFKRVAPQKLLAGEEDRPANEQEDHVRSPRRHHWR